MTLKPQRLYTPEELRDLVRRAREAGPKLAEATERMNKSLSEVESLFRQHLKDARGRVELQRGMAQRGVAQRAKRREWIDFLLYRDGEFFIESNRGGPRFFSTYFLDTSRETRVLICGKIVDLWLACGGPPLPTTVIERNRP